MHPATVKKVLADEETLDIAKTAEAVQEDQRRGVKKDKLTSRVNSSRAHQAWLIRGHEKESFRQKLKEAWNKRNKV
jgi:site-specific recombinase XerC